jgi:isoleucyl-tRNA synthetase
MPSINEQEKEILEFWEKNKIFEKSLKKTEKKKPYIFYDGPPFATGLPHYGHILASVLKDAIPRFWTMNNRYVRRVWGWDCHGLPIENIAEAELKIKSKDEIEKMGVKKFNNFCRSKVLTYAQEWKKTVERIGRWTEFDNSYKTMDNNYIESVWWAFKQLYEKNLIYEGEKILMYCPRCGTPLSKSEIAMDNSYKKVKDQSVTIKFKLVGEEGYALAWTTTPWTLPSNLALTINPNLKYVYIKDKTDKNIYLLGKDLVHKYFKDEKDYSVVKEVKGKELVGKKYEPLFPYFEDVKNAFKIISGNFVTAEDGTGIVHTAPAFGEEDYLVCKENKIELVQPVDNQGRFTEDVVDFKKEYVFDANKKIIEFLKKQGKIVKIENTEHEYPFCYRCETPLIYRAIPSLFINIQKIKPKLLKLNQKINWYPDFLKEGRVNHNISTAPDWNISRNRYWASAIPIWKCENCKEIKVIGSIEELKKEAIKIPKEKIDLHKDYLDNIRLRCKCGREMKRVPEVLDCWFESGSMPFAQFHYPFENKKLFEKNFPSQFVAEYIGQTRAWFYYMNVLSAILFDDIPFENVLTTGTILAEDGTKMSKSKKNFPNPEMIFEKYGVDALRFYLLSSPIMNAENLNFSEKNVEEIYKKIILLLENVNNFYSMYKTGINGNDKSKNILDKWIISRLNQCIEETTKNMKNYDTIKTCSGIKLFIEDLSTWYLRRSRNRFNEDENAEKTLKFVLNEFSKIISPVMPFIAEKIYQNVNSKKDSVHLQNWPKGDKTKIDKKLILKMSIVREIVSAGLKARDKSQIGLKWPLAKGTIFSKEHQPLMEMEEIIKGELNVKEIELKVGHNYDEIKVELDINLTPELEEEGYARELSRQVQAFRKTLDMKKNDKVEMIIISDDKTKKIFEKQREFIMERTNAKNIEFVTTDKEKFKKTIDFKIKDKRGKIVIK